jgi:hypothetical protein
MLQGVQISLFDFLYIQNRIYKVLMRVYTEHWDLAPGRFRKLNFQIFVGKK